MKKMIIALWPISLFLAYQAGNYFAALPVEKSKNDKPAISADKNTVVQVAIHSKDKAKTPLDSAVLTNREFLALQYLTPSEVAEKFAKLKGRSSNFSFDLAQMAELHQLFNNVPDEDIVAVLESLTVDESNQNFITAYSYLLGRYAEQDGEAALSFLKQSELNNIIKSSLQSSIYTAWSTVDSEMAFQHFIDSPDSQKGRFNAISLMGMLGSIAGQDLDLAIDKLKRLNDEGFDINMAAMGISANFTESYQYYDLVTKLALIDDERLVNSTIAMWSAKKPEDAAQWLNDSDDQANKVELANSILTSWAMTDFNSAADWYVSSNFEGKDYQQVIERLVQKTHFVMSPSTIESWINKQDNIDKAELLSNLVVESAYTTPAYSAQNLEKITDDKQKQQTAYSIYSSYLRKNKNLAEQYRENSPYKDEIDKQIIKMDNHRESENEYY